MISDSVKIAKIEAKSKRDMAAKEMILSGLTNPVVEILAGYALIGFMKTIKVGRAEKYVSPLGFSWGGEVDVPLLSDSAGTVAEAALLITIAMQQLKGNTEAMQGITAVTGGIGSLLKAAPGAVALVGAL